MSMDVHKWLDAVGQKLFETIKDFCEVTRIIWVLVGFDIINLIFRGSVQFSADNTFASCQDLIKYYVDLMVNIFTTELFPVDSKPSILKLSELHVCRCFWVTIRLHGRLLNFRSYHERPQRRSLNDLCAQKYGQVGNLIRFGWSRFKLISVHQIFSFLSK